MAPHLHDPNASSRARWYRIVVGVDLSDSSNIVIQHALDQASRHDAAELHFVTVREKASPANDDLESTLWQRVNPALEKFGAQGTIWRARLHIRCGKACEQIAELAAEIRGDLIVIGQFGLHNPGSSHNNMPNRVLQAAACPTLVVGMPEVADTQCAICIELRETTDGESWFCPPHAHANRRLEQTCTPMTTWTGGMLMSV